MTGMMSQVPFRLVVVAVVGLAAAGVLTLMLGWHGLRRLLQIPRVPRPRGMYLALGALWIALVTIGAMSVGTMVLLRDHRRVDTSTQLAEIRCEAVGADHVRVELRTPLAASPERYDIPGDACVVWVKQVELRPGLGLLGVRVLSRIESVGPVRRAAANPDWKSRRFAGLVTRKIEAVPVAVPPDAQMHSVLVSSLTGPALDQLRI